MSDFDLMPDEIIQVESDSTGIVEADLTVAEVFRPVVAGQGEFDGPYHADMTSVGSIKIEFVTDKDAEVMEPDADGVADALPDADVKKFDELRFTRNGENHVHVVRHVKPFHPFGAETHKRLTLKRKYLNEASP